MFFGLALGVYRSAFEGNSSRQYYLGGKAYFLAVLIIFLSLSFWQESEIPRRFIFIFFLVLPFGFIFGRIILHIIYVQLQKKGVGIYKALIAGYEDGESGIFNRIKRLPELGYEIKGFVSSSKVDNLQIRSNLFTRQENIKKNNRAANGFVPIYSFTELSDVIKKENIDRILIPSLQFVSNGFTELGTICQKKKIRLHIISPESEELLRFSYVRDIAGIPLYSPPRSKQEFLSRFGKRVFDISLSMALLIVLSPVFIGIIVAILVEDGKPILFKQKRALVEGQSEFWFYKFRSMDKDAESKQDELYKDNKTSGGLFLIVEDPRLTHVGKFIRKFSLDELPQLINVLKGEMSLVGPRPLSIADLSNITPENQLGGFYKLRARTKPGMTGLWQISGRREVGFKEMVLLDLYYIEHQSFLFDLEILFETFPTVIFGRGAY